MQIQVCSDKNELGHRAARDGAVLIQQAIDQNGQVNVIVATGASQFEMLGELVQKPVDWSKVVFFHLDEYIGLPITHPASFRKYLQDRLLANLPVAPKAFNAIDGEGKSEEVCRNLSRLIRQHPIDVAFIGIGENAHLAFNDPPADFDTEEAYHVVTLDEACRKQQFGEGWFPTLGSVPNLAISMTVPQILRSTAIICSVPDLRKARAVANSFDGPVTPDVPASVLQRHGGTTVYLDPESASKLKAM